MKVTPISSKFYWLANDLALDFVNTQVLHDGPVEELLKTEEDFHKWLTDAGLLGEIAIRTKLGKRGLAAGLIAARKYRDNIRKDLRATGFVSPLSPALVSATNRLLAIPTSVTILQPTKRGHGKLTHEWNFNSSEDLLRPIAASLAELVANGEMRRIRRCKNPDCILYFYDVSRSNTRAWCSLDICGNKLRAAAFRKRHSLN